MRIPQTLRSFSLAINYCGRMFDRSKTQFSKPTSEIILSGIAILDQFSIYNDGSFVELNKANCLELNRPSISKIGDFGL